MILQFRRTLVYNAQKKYNYQKLSIMKPIGIQVRGLRNAKTIQNYSYFLDDLLGRGNQSKVFKGKHDTKSQFISMPDHEVAIKVIRVATLSQGINKKLLESQISCLKKVRGKPNILKMHELIETEENIFIVTELCYGTLSDRIRQKLTEGEAWKYLREIIRGYQSLLQQGIVHRDLKPDNLLINAKGEIKIGDFGFAIAEQQTKKQQIYNVGSPEYMAPEALNKNQYSFKSDIWAIGMIFYEMLTGSTPWKNKKQKYIEEKLTQKFIEKIVKNSSFSPKSFEFLSSTLAFSCHDRMSPEELLTYLSPQNEMQPLRANKSETHILKTQINPEKNTVKKQLPILLKPNPPMTKRIFIKKETPLQEAFKKNKTFTVDKITVSEASKMSEHLLFLVNLCEVLFKILRVVKESLKIKTFLKKYSGQEINVLFNCFANTVIKTPLEIIDLQINNKLLRGPPSHVSDFLKSPEYGKIKQICINLTEKYSTCEQLIDHYPRAQTQKIEGVINCTRNFLHTIAKHIKPFHVDEIKLMKTLIQILPLLKDVELSRTNEKNMHQMDRILKEIDKPVESAEFDRILKEARAL